MFSILQPQLESSAGGPSTLGSLRIKMRLGRGGVAHAERSTCGLQHAGEVVASYPGRARPALFQVYSNFWLGTFIFIGCHAEDQSIGAAKDLASLERRAQAEGFQV
jgi:hypothetical protein